MRRNEKWGSYRLRAFILILSLMMTIVVLPGGAIASTDPASDASPAAAEPSAEPSPTPAEASPAPTEPAVTAPALNVQVDVNQSTAAAAITANPVAGQNFALIVTVRDTTSAHGLITGLTNEDFHLTAFEEGTQTAISEELMKKAVIETFPGVYSVTVQQSSAQPGMDIEVTVKGSKLAGKVSLAVASAGSSTSGCPAEAAIRHYKVAAVQGSLTNAIFALEQDASAIEKGELKPESLILRSALGECMEIELTNRLDIPVTFPIGKTDGSQAAQLAPGGKTAIKYYSGREGTFIIRHVNGVPDEPQFGLYGAVIVEPAGSTFLDPRTGRLNPTGTQANIQGPGADDDFRESVSLFREKDPDLEIYEEEVVFQTVVNYPLATQQGRKASLGLSEYDPAAGTPPMGTFRAYTGDPVKLRIVNANDERVVSFGIDGHTWPSKYGMGDHVYSKAVSDKIVAPLGTLDAILDGGAGGAAGQAGYYIWGNSRLPYIQADEWGVLEVLSGPDSSLLPLADRKSNDTIIVPSTSTPTQNEHFSLNIAGATNAAGELLSGPAQIKVTSSVGTEGTNGIVHDSDVTFENGSAEIQVTLTQAGPQLLIVEMDGAPVSQPVLVNVMPEDHGSVVITPSTTTPQPNDPFELEIDEAKGADGSYLNGSIHVAVTSGTDSLVFDQDVQFTDGWAKIPVSLTQTGEQVLSVQIAGLADALSAKVNVQQNGQSSDLSTATVTPSTAEPTQSKPFTLNIKEAKGTSGDYLAGAVNVQVTAAGSVFNGDVDFTSGSAKVPITLADGGQQTLTIKIAGVTLSQTATVNVQVDDRSTAVVTASTSAPTQNQAFPLSITGAKGIAGEDLSGSINVKVTTGDTTEGTSGILYNGTVTFTNGAATVPVTLTNTGEHTLTIEIAGVTASQNVVVNVQAPVDLSTATVSASTLKPMEKKSFTLQISGAKGFKGANLTGAIQVTIRSSNENEGRNGLVKSGSYTFTNGAASIPLALERRGTQTLTITITGVTAAQTIAVEVLKN